MIRKTLFLFVLLPLLFITCTRPEKSLKLTDAESKSVIQKIKAKGKIVASTDFNSINYFIYKGQPMGYQYDLLKSFSTYLGVELEIVVNNDINKAFECLNGGVCDIVAMDLTQTYGRAKMVDFSVPLVQTRQILVQRKSTRFHKKSMLRNPIDLGGKTVVIQKGSAYAERLHNLQEEIGDSIHIVEDPNCSAEELIFLVSKGKIDYTICDEHLSSIYENNYENLDFNTPISFPQNLGWAVKKGSNHLLQALNDWLRWYKNTKQFRLTYNKYFKNSQTNSLANADVENLQKGIISRYDKLIMKHSRKIGWDWRLLASLIYHESEFQPNVRSSNGAFGLMQLMPQTARRYGVTPKSSANANIAAGVNYLKYINKEFSEIKNPEERTKFILAAYNVGIGHVMDARRLALKNKKDPDTWAYNVDWYMLQKSNPDFYNDSVVLFGYCPGQTVYNFVNEIYERYYHYKNITEK